MDTQTKNLINEDCEYDSDGIRDIGEKCPECGGNIVEYYESNGPADYNKTWECKGCGETWSN